MTFKGKMFVSGAGMAVAGISVAMGYYLIALAIYAALAWVLTRETNRYE